MPEKYKKFVVSFIFLCCVHSLCSQSFAQILPDTQSFVASSAHSSDFLRVPTFLDVLTAKPRVLLELNVTSKTYESAYPFKPYDERSLFDSSQLYFGYFDNMKQYRYLAAESVFLLDESLERGDFSAWDGNFLNWLSARKVDQLRLALIGGKLAEPAARLIAGERVFVVNGGLREASVALPVIEKYATNSANFSPVPNGLKMTVDGGELRYADRRFALRIAKKQKPEGLIQQYQSRINWALSLLATSSQKGSIEGDILAVMDTAKSTLVSDTSACQRHFTLSRHSFLTRLLANAILH